MGSNRTLSAFNPRAVQKTPLLAGFAFMWARPPLRPHPPLQRTAAHAGASRFEGPATSPATRPPLGIVGVPGRAGSGVAYAGVGLSVGDASIRQSAAGSIGITSTTGVAAPQQHQPRPWRRRQRPRHARHHRRAADAHRPPAHRRPACLHLDGRPLANRWRGEPRHGPSILVRAAALHRRRRHRTAALRRPLDAHAHRRRRRGQLEEATAEATRPHGTPGDVPGDAQRRW